jgi:hypothetical protein
MLASSRYWAAHDRKAETASRQEGATAEKAVPFSKPRLSIVIPPYELRLYAPRISAPSSSRTKCGAPGDLCEVVTRHGGFGCRASSSDATETAVYSERGPQQ